MLNSMGVSNMQSVDRNLDKKPGDRNMVWWKLWRETEGDVKHKAGSPPHQKQALGDAEDDLLDKGALISNLGMGRSVPGKCV